MKLTRREFLYVIGGALVAACSGANREPDYTIVIERAKQFNPAALVIPVGSIVAWHNMAATVHTVTADPSKAQMPERVSLPADAASFDSGDLFSGERWVYRFEMPGTYIYFCRYHEMEEMIGTITVFA